MTCIVGLVDNGAVWMGADSAGISDWFLRPVKAPKVFRNGDCLFGYTSSFRMGQLLEHALNIPDRDARSPLEAYLATEFVDAVRKCLKDGGYAKKKDEEESAGEFLVGIEGRLFCVCRDYCVSDYCVSENTAGFDAAGCGRELALGVLSATASRPPRDRILAALAAAEQFSAGVRGPFDVVALTAS